MVISQIKNLRTLSRQFPDDDRHNVNLTDISIQKRITVQKKLL